MKRMTRNIGECAKCGGVFDSINTHEATCKLTRSETGCRRCGPRAAKIKRLEECIDNALQAYAETQRTHGIRAERMAKALWNTGN